MGTVTLCLATVLSLFFIVQNASALDLESFLVDTLDSTMLALEKDRATKDMTKLVTVPQVTTVSTKMNKGKWQAAEFYFEVVILQNL